MTTPEERMKAAYERLNATTDHAKRLFRSAEEGGDRFDRERSLSCMTDVMTIVHELGGHDTEHDIFEALCGIARRIVDYHRACLDIIEARLETLDDANPELGESAIFPETRLGRAAQWIWYWARSNDDVYSALNDAAEALASCVVEVDADHETDARLARVLFEELLKKSERRQRLAAE